MKRIVGAGFVVAGTMAGMAAGALSRGSMMFGSQGVLLLAAAGFALVGAFLIARSDAGRVGWALAAAAAFNPARRRIQRVVDRRFHRARFDAEREIETLAAAVGSAMTLAAVEESTTRVIGRTVQPSQVSLWVRSDR